MFARDVIGSDAFADLGFEAQALFVHLCMEADDYGFVSAPKKLVRSIGSSAKALSELEQRGFTHSFGSGVLVILSWWQNNTITESRRKATIHTAELALLEVAESGLYVCNEEPKQIASKPQAKPTETKAKRKAYGEYKNVMLSDEELEKLKAEFPDWKQRIEQCSSYCASKGKAYKNYLATIRNWAKKDGVKAVRDDGVFDAIGAAIGG